MVSAKCDKVLPIVALKMRKLSPVKSLRYGASCGDSRPRLSAERTPQVFDCSADEGWPERLKCHKILQAMPIGNLASASTGELALARTAEGGCPHMSCAINHCQAKLELFSFFGRHEAPIPLRVESLPTDLGWIDLHTADVHQAHSALFHFRARICI